MRVLVCGGRSYNDHRAVFKALDEFKSFNAVSLIIQGGSKGADRHALDWSLSRNVPRVTEKALWKDLTATPLVLRHYKDGTPYNAAAGNIRNQKMLDYHKPDVVIAFPGGYGTADMVRRADAAGVRVLYPIPDDPVVEDTPSEQLWFRCGTISAGDRTEIDLHHPRTDTWITITGDDMKAEALALALLDLLNSDGVDI